jgi:hypothetical protein
MGMLCSETRAAAWDTWDTWDTGDTTPEAEGTTLTEAEGTTPEAEATDCNLY